MKAWVALALLLSSDLAFGKPKRATPRRGPRPALATQTPTGRGQITFATATTAYLDRGLIDGLAVGMGVTVTRQGRLVGRCTIATASEKWSTCSIEGMKVGDQLGGIDRALPPPPPAPPVPADAALLARRRLRVEAEAVPLVDYGGAVARLFTGGARHAAIAATHSSWADLASAGGPFHVERVDLGIYEVPIWQGLHASADLSVLHFTQRPAQFRSPVGSTALLVRQLEVSFHRPDFPLIAQAGRTFTRHTPGLLMVDGAQAAWRNRDDTFEAGAYGGLLPDPATLQLSTRWGVGAFVMARFEPGQGRRASLVQVEGRLGYAARALTGAGRFEVAVAVRSWIARALDAHLQLELGVGAVSAPGFVDGARLELGWRPTEAVQVHAGASYRGSSGSDTFELGVTLPGGQPAIHADGGLTIELSPALWLGAATGVAADLSTALRQVRFGPELTLPRLFGGAAVLTLGYQEELGWLRGRTAWAQLVVTPAPRLRILGRGSWFHQEPAVGDEGIAGHEVGAALAIDLSIARWLWVRASVLGRGQPAVVDNNPGSPVAGTVLATVGGQL